MGILSGSTDFFGLDIGTSAVRVVQMKGGKTKVLARYGSVDIDEKIAQSDSNVDQQKLGQIIKKLLADSGISSKNVAVGLSSQRVFITVVDIERLAEQELDKALRLQADSLIPTPLDESKIDWALLGESPKDPAKVEVLLSSVVNSFVERRLDMLESLGLNVIAFEPDSIALTRALLAPGTNEPFMVLDMGLKSTDLVITMNDAPRLVRTIPIGSDSIIKAAMQNLGIDEGQANQFVFKFGLNQDKLEGQIYGAISSTVDVLIAEIEKSIKFFTARYKDTKVAKMSVTGAAATLPEFPLVIANKFGASVEIGNAWRNATFQAGQQNDLLSVANKYSVAAGLAERVES